ncbi:hypothetical protein NESM_000259900 [Novymonas esmeraldas]|uniref:Uncharacterized protein n=1 Tax=Novymonas esmeraldas TaxID=1808958 RepID=A0AAW0F6H4_9TRYP
MGNTHSEVPEEGQGHPAHYYLGVAAAKEARFTVAELHFVQALQKHPGRHFWDTLMGAVFRDTSSTGDAEDGKAATDYATGMSNLSDLQPNNIVRAPPTVATKVASHEQRGGSGGSSNHHNKRSFAALTAKKRATLRPVSGASAASLYEPNAVDVELPLNTDLHDVLDLVRLMADVALTYLTLLSSTRHTERVTSLAARYCLLTISHTQMLLHCLALWKEENLRDGLGFIDYEKKRRLCQSALPTVAVAEDVVEEEEEEESMRRDSSERGRHSSRASVRTASMLFTLALAEANCRYYHLSLLISYSLLLVQTHAVTAMDRRKQNAIYANAVQHLDAAFSVVWALAAEHPDDYLSQVTRAHFPSAGSLLHTTTSGSGSGSSGSVQRGLLLGGDTGRYLCMCGAPWSPLQSGLLPVELARRVRLFVQSGVSPRSQARLLSPAQRMSFHYLSWQSATVFLCVPGRSLYLLERALPDFKPGTATLSCKTEMVLRDATGVDSQCDGEDDVDVSGAGVVAAPAAAAPLCPEEVMMADLHPEIQRAPPAMSGVEQRVFLKKCRHKVLRNGRRMNTDLDLSDERTCVMLCQEEAVVVASQGMLLAVSLRSAVGQTAEAAAYSTALTSVVSACCGPHSAEVHMVRSTLDPEKEL